MIYYLFIILIAAVFYYLLLLKKDLFFGSKFLIFLLAFWVLVICSLFPGILSILSPLSALAATVFLAVSGGYLIYSIAAHHKVLKSIPLLLLPAGTDTPQLLPAGTDTPQLLPAGTNALQLLPIGLNALQLLPIGTDDLQLLHVIINAPPLLPPPANLEPDPSEAVLSSVEEPSLDELINAAFQAKEDNNIALAIELFQSALEYVEDSSIKGMICTELVFLFRERGRYADAAKLMEGFLAKNVSFLSPDLYSQFKRLVSYLQKLNELLIELEQPNLPFSQVPPHLKLSAEQALKE